MVNESRLRGDYHEFVTVHRLCEETESREINLPKGLTHGKMLPPNVQKAIEEAGEQTKNKIMDLIESEFGAVKYVQVEAVGNIAGATTIENVTDLVVTILPIGKGMPPIDKTFSLKFTRGGAAQLFTKNMGLKSLLANYFNSPNLQTELNNFNKLVAKEFFDEILKSAEGKGQFRLTDYIKRSERRPAKIPETRSLRDARSRVKYLPKKYLRFNTNPAADSARQKYMNKLRDKLFELLQKVPKSDVIRGCKLILGAESKAEHLIVSYWEGSTVHTDVERLPDLSGEPEMIKVGNNSIHFKFKEATVGCRVKHEGGSVLSSVKFAGSLIR